MDKVYDIAIIGAGPAGLSAAVNAAARNKSTIVLGRKPDSSWLYTAERVDNHLGMAGMSGKDMLDAFYEHVGKVNIEIKEGRAQQALLMGEYYSIDFKSNAGLEYIDAKTVIIATGRARFKSVKGESELLGKGVSYCATCDAMLYRGKTVVVVGETPEGEEDANFLSEVCGKVYYIYNYDTPPHLNENIEIITGAVKEVIGEDFVTGVRLNEEEIPCEGAFFIKESIPVTSLITGLEMEGNAIKVNRMMETNLRGVYAAGDSTGWPYQVSNAVGDGLVAAQQCVRFLDRKMSQNKSL